MYPLKVQACVRDVLIKQAGCKMLMLEFITVRSVGVGIWLPWFEVFILDVEDRL